MIPTIREIVRRRNVVTIAPTIVGEMDEVEMAEVEMAEVEAIEIVAVAAETVEGTATGDHVGTRDTAYGDMFSVGRVRFRGPALRYTDMI